MKQVDVTELDFAQIKENIIDYFKNVEGGKYADYDFTGSGLNQILDILAYNTHYNAITAHTAINESFLDSAQLRSNVVSRAKSLGYTPRSRSAPKAVISLTFDGAVNGNAASFTLDAGKKIQTSVDGKTYIFVTLSSYVAPLIDGQYVFDSVEFYQGVVKVQKFITTGSPDNDSFIINDPKCDTSLLQVKVFENANTTSFESYSLFSNFSGLDDTSLVYFLDENHSGNFEIRFGNNIIGKFPTPKSVVSLEYLSTEGDIANDANVFTWASGAPAPLFITTITKSFGGAELESINSIRSNAPLTFIAQDRAVTTSDYKALIARDFPTFESVAVWGGQDNDPPQYGKVFISVKPLTNETLNDTEKADLISRIREKNVVTVLPEVIDPDYTYIYAEVLFEYDPNLTSLRESQLVAIVIDKLKTFNSEKLMEFNSTFRYSKFLSEIDSADKSITSSNARIFIYKKLPLAEVNNSKRYVNFAMELYEEGQIISSDSFKYRGAPVRIRDKETTSPTIRNIILYSEDLNGIQTEVTGSVGTIDISTGLMSIGPVPMDIGEESETINLYSQSASNDVVSKRNNLIAFDVNTSEIVGRVDKISAGGSSGAIRFTPFNRHK